MGKRRTPRGETYAPHLVALQAVLDPDTRLPYVVAAVALLMGYRNEVIRAYLEREG